MGPGLEVDPDAVRALAAQLNTTATVIGALVPPDPVAMPNSAVSTASAAASDAIAAAYRAMAHCIDDMAVTATANAAGYGDADDTFRDQLQHYEAGLS